MGIVRKTRRARGIRWAVAVVLALSTIGVAAPAASATSAPAPVPVPAPSSEPGIGAYVVGGEPIAAGQFPALAAIMVDEPDIPARLRLLCTGTVVSPRWILSAGHCSTEVLYNLPLVVQVGSRDLGGANAQTIAINRATVHRTYFKRGVGYDVALFHTASTINAPATRLATEADAALETGGRSAVAAGWGLTKKLGIEEYPGFNARPPRRARSVQVPIVGDAQCGATFEDFAPGYFIAASDLCAGDEGRDVCYGDSGGPLYATDPHGAAVQIGITSRGAGCATKLFPGIFTAVRKLEPWIHRWSTHACPNKVEIPDFPDEPGFPEDQPNGPLYVC